MAIDRSEVRDALLGPQATAQVAALSHQGAARRNNEDCALVGGFVLSESTDPTPMTMTLQSVEPVIVAVADGLGGHGGGELAAATAIRRVAQDAIGLTSEEAVADAVRQASSDVQQQAAATRGAHDMGTTIVGLAITPEQIFCFNVGDSPAFRLEDGYLLQIVTLDSPADTAGIDSANPEPSNLVTQVLGPGTSRLVPHVSSFEPREGDVYLLCSDGLTDMVPLTEIERLLQENPDDDERAVKALWAAAMNAGGRDNITIAIVRPGIPTAS